MNTLVIGIGSNSKDCQQQMACAMEHLATLFYEVKVSSVYETPALNGKDASYLNAVAIAKTDMELSQATSCLKQWEKQCGRTPESKLQGSIPIDLDIVVWNDDVLREKDFSYSFFTKGYKELVD
ncbi:MAG: 2-amino-4-hydroxy-6-hydroxymethyldihydropteridine diphosphokinase [Muribaculaceae bacterium]|nr:2-amino-4-hydroxy-6-hydroxymethyldihydropteridine diphosphokinase [Muribaculaceae bacterium]